MLATGMISTERKIVQHGNAPRTACFDALYSPPAGLDLRTQYLGDTYQVSENDRGLPPSTDRANPDDGTGSTLPHVRQEGPTNIERSKDVCATNSIFSKTGDCDVQKRT